MLRLPFRARAQAQACLSARRHSRLDRHHSCRQFQLRRSNRERHVEESSSNITGGRYRIFLSTCLTDQAERHQKAYDDYLVALEQFEIGFLPELPPVCTARLRREAGATDASIHFAVLTRQPPTVDPALRWQIFQNSSLPAQYDPLAPTLAGTQNANPAPSGMQFANVEAEDYEGDEGEPATPA